MSLEITVRSKDDPSSFDKPVEHCGVIGIIDFEGNEAVRRGINLLTNIQHRGQDSAGILTLNHGFHHHRGMGLVDQIFTETVIGQNQLEGSLVIGHNRYKTQGGDSLDFTQPLLNDNFGFAHNGNIPELEEQRARLRALGLVPQPDFDSNILGNLIRTAKGDNWIERMQNGLKGVRGSYSFVAITPDRHLLAGCDPWRNRPLAIAQIESGYAIASESVAFSVLEPERWREIKPGEIIDISEDGAYSSSLLEKARRASCFFEPTYFAFETSIINGETVARFRTRLGSKVAINHPSQAEVTTAVPDSSCSATIAFSRTSGIPEERLILKKRSRTKRTFMMGEMKNRREELETKFEISPDVEGRHIVEIDDSIVCGNTLSDLNKKVYKRGATRIDARSTAPKIIADCEFGVNMRSSDGKFVALDDETGEVLSDEKIAEKMGIDSVGYLSLQELREVIEEGGQNPDEFCYKCVGGPGFEEAKLKAETPRINKLELD